MTRLLAMVVLAGVLVAPLVHAEQEQSKASAGATHEASAMADGEIRKVDKDGKKITIKHGPLPSLEMPAMTMVFRVKDPAMLEQVKQGDKVRFVAEKLGGALTLVRLEPAK